MKMHVISNYQLTSAHSVEPRRPNSSASQLANKIVLLGLHPEIHVHTYKSWENAKHCQDITIPSRVTTAKIHWLFRKGELW